MIPDGVHHKRCSTELIYGHHLDPKLPWHQAVLVDSYVYEVSNWAINSVMYLWDIGVPVRLIIGVLAGLQQDDDVSFDAVNKEMETQIEAYIDSLSEVATPDSDPQIEALMDWKDGLHLTAQMMLEAIVRAESNRN